MRSSSLITHPSSNYDPNDQSSEGSNNGDFHNQENWNNSFKSTLNEIEHNDSMIDNESTNHTFSDTIKLNTIQNPVSLFINTNVEKLTKRKREATPRTPPIFTNNFVPKTPRPKRRKRVFGSGSDRLRDIIINKPTPSLKRQFFSRSINSINIINDQPIISKSPLTRIHSSVNDIHSSDDDSTISSDSVELAYTRKNSDFIESKQELIMEDTYQNTYTSYEYNNRGSSSSQIIRKPPNSLYKESLQALSANTIAESLSELSISGDVRIKKNERIIVEEEMQDVDTDTHSSSQEWESDISSSQESDWEDFLDESKAIFHNVTPDSPILNIIRPRVNRKLFN